MPAGLQRHYRLRVAGGEGVRVGGDEVAGAVAVPAGLAGGLMGPILT